MNAHALAVLEYEEALRAVAARAGSPLSRDALLARLPATDPDEARRELARAAEALRFLDEHPDWAPPHIPDARRPLEQLSVEGGVLDPEGLLLLRRLLAATRELRGALKGEGGSGEAPPVEPRGAARRGQPRGEQADPPGPRPPGEFPHLAALRARLPARPDDEKWMDGLVDEEGEVRDSASPALRSIRGKLRAARSRIVQRLEGFLGTLPERYRVGDASVSVRDGRYVIPIRREGKSEVGGIVHGESGTGATLFVEPPLAIQLMNEVQELERDEAREVQRILRDATGRLRPDHGELEGGFQALVDFDGLWARSLTARAWDAAPPELLDPEAGELEVTEGRHPLLLEKGEGEVVPFFLKLDPGDRALVVSGPNTGGKTVFLKAMGLIHLLAQAGVIPPVGPGTRLPVLRDVFADIGDEQSIAESLSTFSAHLANAREIVEGAGPGTLVVMDEMGTGTDPAEGAALARAILETLVEKGARAVVTSHLGALKRLDAEGSGIVNASLLFDPDRLEPTYELRKGRPGRSYGLAIARRLGFPGSVLDRAEGYVHSGELEVERLLETLEGKERDLERALAEAEEARTEARKLREEVGQRERELEERERTAEARAREEARRVLLEAREEVERAIREVREADESGRAAAETRARRAVEEAARRQEELRPEPPSPRRSSGLAEAAERTDVTEGDRVRVRGSGASGVLRELRDDRAMVEVGGLRLQVSLSELEPVAKGDAGVEEPRPKKGTAGGWSAPDLKVSHEADLRGLRVEEVDLELGRALDGAVVGNLSELRIIHGKGTGAVKARVRELLQGDPRVKEARPGGRGEGGAGVTVAVLR